MKKLVSVLLLMLTLALSACSQKRLADTCKGDVIEDCVCIQIYDPVCGCDGIT